MSIVEAGLQNCKIINKAIVRSVTYYNYLNNQNIRSQNPNSKFLVQTRRKMSSGNYWQHKYSSAVECAVNNQIQAEQQAAQDYLNMAVAFLHPSQSRPGAGGFFMRMFDEEIGHMQDFVNYQLSRGGFPVISGLTAPKPKCNITLLEAFTKGLQMEITITKLLESLVAIAEADKDYQCADYVTSVFLEEQMRSISEMANHVTRLARLCDEHAIYHYDVELSRKYPWAYKRKEPA